MGFFYYLCNMKKEIKKEKIFTKHFDGWINGIRFSELPKDIKDDDIIDIEKCEGYYSENNSWDDYTELIVYREREETDEEFEKRKKFWEEKKAESKKARYENYLKLKKEFESE